MQNLRQPVGTASIEVRSLSPAGGAEIIGVDFTQPCDAATAQAIRDAWHEHLVLIVRGQDLAAEDQTRFCQIFGALGGRTRPLELRRELTTGYGSGEVMFVSNIRVDGKAIGSLPDGEMLFHIDQCFTELPAMANTLYAIEVPSSGGDTMFANLYRAYETLPDEIKRRIAGRKALNFYQYNAVNAHDNQLDEKARNFTHPIVRTHPATGRRSLFVNRLMTHHIVDMDPDESHALLTLLFDHLEQPEFVYTHKWQPKDLLIWDNRCTAHARTDFDPTERRHLRRFTVKNDAPVMAG
jgi:taurine dioxygenase